MPALLGPHLSSQSLRANPTSGLFVAATQNIGYSKSIVDSVFYQSKAKKKNAKNRTLPNGSEHTRSAPE